MQDNHLTFPHLSRPPQSHSHLQSRGQSEPRSQSDIQEVSRKLQRGITDCGFNPFVPKAFQLPIQSEALQAAIIAIGEFGRAPLEEVLQHQQQQIGSQQEQIDGQYGLIEGQQALIECQQEQIQHLQTLVQQLEQAIARLSLQPLSNPEVSPQKAASSKEMRLNENSFQL